MNRDARYLVLKREDIAKHLTFEEVGVLNQFLAKIREGREVDGKTDAEYVVRVTQQPKPADAVVAVLRNTPYG